MPAVTTDPQPAVPQRARRALQVLLLVAVAGGAVWFVFRDVRWSAFTHELGRVDVPLFAAGLALFAGRQVVRALRWGRLVDEVRPQIRFRSIFAISSIGYFLINVLPFRLGELVRPVLLLEQHEVPLGAGAATVVVERVFDVLALGALLVGVLLWGAAGVEATPLSVYGHEVELVQLGRTGLLALLLALAGPAALQSCDGDDDDDASGDDDSAAADDDDDADGTESSTGDWTAVSTGYTHSCGIINGFVECWGDNQWGQGAPPSATFNQVSAGYKHSCGVLSDSTVVCWGSTIEGQMAVPEGPFASVSSGYYHACALDGAGLVTCWGCQGGQDAGQCNGSVSTFIQISAGNKHTCGVRSDNAVECWGCGAGQDQGQCTPPASAFYQVSAGGTHTCGVNTSGEVECWGLNFAGAIEPRPGPFSTVSVGNSHTCAIRLDGAILCWGSNSNGQSSSPNDPGDVVGDDDDDDDDSAGDWRPPPGDDDDSAGGEPSDGFTRVSSGGFHTCGLREDTHVVCWGCDGGGDAHSGQCSPP